MKKSIRTGALLSLMCLSLIPIAAANAANWVYVTTNSSDTDYYFDSDTIQRSGNQVTVWINSDHSRDKTVEARSKKMWQRFDCATRTTALLQVTIYYPNGKNETFTWNNYEQQLRAVVPDTAGESMLEAVCR